MNSNYLYPGSDLEGDARESADLKVGLKMPEITRRPMPVMSDASTASRTPHWHRAKIAHTRVRMEGWRQRRLG